MSPQHQTDIWLLQNVGFSGIGEGIKEETAPVWSGFRDPDWSSLGVPPIVAPLDLQRIVVILCSGIVQVTPCIRVYPGHCNRWFDLSFGF